MIHIIFKTILLDVFYSLYLFVFQQAFPQIYELLSTLYQFESVRQIQYEAEYFNSLKIDLLHIKIIVSHMDSLLSNQTITNQPEPEKTDSRVFFMMLERAGAFGRYQKITTLIYCIIGYLCGGLMLIIPFLFYEDPYDCKGVYPADSCFDDVCKLDLADRKQFIPTPSMTTLANQFGDFRCSKEKLVIDQIITVMYVGTVVGFLALTVVGDLIGRKRLLTICTSLAVVGLVITIFCVNLKMAGAGLFLATVGIQNAFNICFYFIAETISEEYREKVSVAIQLFYGLGVLLNVLWYFAVGDWQLIFIIFYLIPAVLVVASVMIIIKDTPICLVMRNGPLKALKDFRYIAKMNQIQDFSMDVEEIEEVKRKYGSNSGEDKSQKKFSILDLFKFKSLRGMTIMLIVLQCTIIFEFYAPALMLDKFKMDIFINGLVVGVSEIISYPICYFIIMKSRRQYVAYGCFGLAFICSMILTFIWNQSDQNPDIGNSIGVLILIFIFRFAVSVQYTFFYVYFNELYPTQIRVIGTSLISVMGGAMVTIAPQIIDGCINGGFPVMILFAALSAFSAFFSYKLPETLHKVPADVIEELREDHRDSMISNPEEIFAKQSLLQGKKSTNYTSSEPDVD